MKSKNSNLRRLQICMFFINAFLIFILVIFKHSTNKRISSYEREKHHVLNLAESIRKDRKNFISSRFQKRQKHYENTCKRLGLKKKFRPKNVFLTALDNQAVGCFPQKSASSSWFGVFRTLRNFTPDASDPDIWTQTTKMSKFTSEQELQTIFLPETIKIITVRDPLSRLYSGWQEHMRLVNGSPIGQQWRLLGLTEKDYDLKTQHSCSWKDFVHKMVDAMEDKKLINGHHEPLSKRCPVCSISYNYIAKVETMLDDSSFILHDLMKTDLTLGLQNSRVISNKNMSCEKYLEHYCQFSDTEIQKLENYYRLDYALFAYKKFSRKKCC